MMAVRYHPKYLEAPKMIKKSRSADRFEMQFESDNQLGSREIRSDNST